MAEHQSRHAESTGIDPLQDQRHQTAEQGTKENAVRQALGQLDPRAGDQSLGYVDVLHRMQAAIDVELSRWSSAVVQQPGPSGVTAVPETPPAEKKDE